MEISTVKDAMEKPLEPKVMDLVEVLDFFSVEMRKIIKLGKYSVSQQSQIREICFKIFTFL